MKYEMPRHYFLRKSGFLKVFLLAFSFFSFLILQVVMTSSVSFSNEEHPVYFVTKKVAGALCSPTLTSDLWITGSGSILMERTVSPVIVLRSGTRPCIIPPAEVASTQCHPNDVAIDSRFLDSSNNLMPGDTVFVGDYPTSDSAYASFRSIVTDGMPVYYVRTCVRYSNHFPFDE